jgi:hypothetical protein
MNKPLPMHLSPRCRATSKRTHKPCQAPAVRGWTVCHFHGAGGGAPRGKRNGMYRHGQYTREELDYRRKTADLLRCVRALMREAREPLE